VDGGRVHRGGRWCVNRGRRGGVHRCWGGVDRGRGGVHLGRGRVHRGSGGDDFSALRDLGYETVDVIGGVRHGSDCAVGFGQAVLSLDYAIGQALFGCLVIAGGRVGHAVLVRVRRVRVDRVVDGRWVSGVSDRSGGHHGGGRVVLCPDSEYGEASKANCYLWCKYEHVTVLFYNIVVIDMI